MGPGKLVDDPRGQGRIAFFEVDPGQGEGRLPPQAGHVGDGGFHRGGAGLVLEQVPYAVCGVGGIGPRRLPQGGEDYVGSRLSPGSAEVVVGGQHVGRGLAELSDLVGEDVEGELAVQQGVVAGLPDQASVLVVLDQVVVGAARVGEGVEPQGIDDGETEQIKVGIDGPQVGDVVFQDVVAHYEGGALAQLVDAPDAGGVSGVVALEVEFIAGVGPVGGHGDEAAILVYFQVQRKAVPEGRGH